MWKFLIVITIVFFLIAVAILRPVPIVSEDRAIVEKGIVADIYEGGKFDVVFLLENTERRFYINRGLENGLNLDTLKEKLIGKEVTLKYPKYWTPLDWDDKIKHISKLEFKGQVLFNELI